MSDNNTKAKVPVTKGAKSPTAKKAEVIITKLPVSWMGFDKINMPPDQADNGTGWLGVFIDNSNMRFAGAYLTGPPLPAIDATFFTSSTTTTKRHWVANIGSLRDQGWGIVFWYVGYSVGGGHAAPAGLSTIAAERGKLHALHAKTIIQATNPKLAGSVVFLDNEDNDSVPATELNTIKAYYNAFFNELETETPAPGRLPAMRCGLYAHGKVAEYFVKERTDLFVWDVRRDTGLDAEPAQPFEDNINPLYVDPTWKVNPTPKGKGEREMHALKIQGTETNAADTWNAWPLGRQFRRYTGATPTNAWVVASGVQNLKAVHDEFDYNSSLVRDPSYPVAEPRIAATTNSIVVAGSFKARSAGGTNPPRMKIESIESNGRNHVPAVSLVEPDAPIAVAAFPGAETHYVTVRDDTCDLVAFKRDLNGAWSAIDVIIFMNGPVLRRLRAIALVAYDANDLHLFFAGDDHQLYTSRSQSPGAWDAPAVVGDLPALHPFTSLIAASRSGQSVDIFALDDQGLLSTWSWLPTQGTWQKARLDATVPQLVPSLLKASALAATSPDAQKLFVFGVRKDLRLAYWEWTGPDGGWSKQKAPIEWSSRLSPHTRLAVHGYPGFVEAAGLNHEGTLRLYSLELTGTTWIARSPIRYDNPDNVQPAGYIPPPATSLTEQAYGWKLNPYGDLAIAREATGTIVYAAGIAPGRTGVLRLNVSIEGSTWELFR